MFFISHLYFASWLFRYSFSFSKSSILSDNFSAYNFNWCSIYFKLKLKHTLICCLIFPSSFLRRVSYFSAAFELSSSISALYFAICCSNWIERAISKDDFIYSINVRRFCFLNSFSSSSFSSDERAVFLLNYIVIYFTAFSNLYHHI